MEGGEGLHGAWACSMKCGALLETADSLSASWWSCSLLCMSVINLKYLPHSPLPKETSVPLNFITTIERERKLGN